MFYEYICIDKCNRLTKPTIVIRPTKRIQMVLGTNGSGKSSLLSIGFSPLPANADDFFTGGSREVHIEHLGRKFVIIEKFDKKNYYSFSVDGEEKNDGHTITVQLELCKEYFGYTREIHDFLTGQVKFTALSALQRRDWIAKMSSADFGFAFREFERFRKGMSAAKAVVDHLSKRVNEEKARLLDPEDAAQMRARAVQLKEEIRELMGIKRVDGCLSWMEVMDEYNQMFNHLNRFSKAEYPRLLQGGKSFEDLEADLLNRKNVLEAITQERASALGELNQRLERIKGLMEIDPDALASERDGLNQQLEAIPEVRVELHASMLVRCDNVIHELRGAVQNLPATRITHQQLMEISDKLQSKQSAYHRADNLMNNIVERLHQIDRCDTVTCPSCNHGFKPGINASEVADLKERQNRGVDFIQVATTELDSVTEQYTEAEQNFRNFSRLDEIRRKYAQQYPGIFAYLDSVGGFDLGRGLHAKLALYERAVSVHEARSGLVKRIEEIQNALNNYEREGSGLATLQEQRDALFKSYRQSFEERNEAVVDLSRTRQERTYSEDWHKNYENAERAVEMWKCELRGVLDQEAWIMAQEEIAKLQTTLAINETALAEDDLVLTIVKDMENQLQKKLIEHKAFKILADEMSPKTGLIADQIIQQLGAIAGGVNQMIKRVWNHSMFIQLPDRETTDLDYKFPIIDENRPRSDISKGSDSMLEIVNRAFVLTFYYCTNLSGYPLWLDEPGRTFDETHSHNLIPLIKDLVDSDKFSQILIISHDPDNQRAFPDSETIIIDDRNINYPHPYNQHVEFEVCVS